MRRLLLLAGLLTLPVSAQPADPCPMGAAVGWLEGADVRGALFNTGHLFFGTGYTNGDGYLTPLSGEDAGKSPLYNAGLWLGGRVSGEVRVSGSRYTNFSFRPGAAGPDGAPPTPAECADADRIWVVARTDVERYLRDGTLTDDLRDWPVTLGAPVLDGDGVAGNYDLAGGDQPAITGDVTAFWAMTDTATDQFFGPVLGVDVTVEAFAFRRASPNGSLDAATVYRYTVTNRTGATIRDLHAGLWLDPDLGNAVDDYIGADTTRHMAVMYNADNDDEGSTGYGVPPALGAVIVDSPPGADGRPLGMTAFRNVQGGGGGLFIDPVTADQMYQALLGRWNDGTPVRERGYGYDPQSNAPITTFAFAGDPVTGAFWSERDNGQGGPNPPGDRRATAASGPVTLAPGEATSWTFALVFAQGSDHLDSIVRLRGRADQMHALQAAGVFEPSRVGSLPTPPPVPPVAIRRPAPNPFAGATALRLRGLAGEAVTLTVADVLGRVVERRDVTPTADDVDVSLGAGLAPGVYVVRVAGRGFDLGFPVVKTR